MLFQSCQINKYDVKNLKLECSMLHRFFSDEQIFPQLQSLWIIIRKIDELSILLKYFPLFTKLKKLYIKSDVCCCDRTIFEENVKQNLFQTNHHLQSLIFATPPCYSLSLQDMNFEQCLFTNLTVKSMFVIS